MKIAFFASSAGDTDLALNTIRTLEANGNHQVYLIALTKTAQDRIANFQSSAVVCKKTLLELVALKEGVYPTGSCTLEQIEALVCFIKQHEINQVYCGIPSVNSEVPFQLALALDNIPVLMAYEFMFKPEPHYLWNYLSTLKSKSNLHWAIPLNGVVPDFGLEDNSKVHVVGHLSIDNAFAASSTPKTAEEIRQSQQIAKDKIAKNRNDLQISEGKSFAFVSSTTQPVVIDASFLDALLLELPKHPNIEVRLGLHPGIVDLDTYLTEILSVCQRYNEACSKQFKIILPDDLFKRLKMPELTVTNSKYEHIFWRVNMNGNEASYAADRVAQAVPGALLNQGALEGKPSYSHFGTPYLPREYFSKSLNAFFTSERQEPHSKKDLGLDNKSSFGTLREIAFELVAF